MMSYFSPGAGPPLPRGPAPGAPRRFLPLLHTVDSQDGQQVDDLVPARWTSSPGTSTTLTYQSWGKVAAVWRLKAVTILLPHPSSWFPCALWAAAWPTATLLWHWQKSTSITCLWHKAKPCWATGRAHRWNLCLWQKALDKVWSPCPSGHGGLP